MLIGAIVQYKYGQFISQYDLVHEIDDYNIYHINNKHLILVINIFTE